MTVFIDEETRKRVERRRDEMLAMLGSKSWTTTVLRQRFALERERAIELGVKFDPDQPRDESGKWTSGGGDGGGSDRLPSAVQAPSSIGTAPPSKGPAHASAMLARAHSVAEREGIDTSLITVGKPEDSMTVINNKIMWTQAAVFVGNEDNPSRMELYPDLLTDENIDGAMAHEINHLKWLDVRGKAQAGDQATLLAMDEAFAQYPQEAFSKVDGVSPYSAQYWEMHEREPGYYPLAVAETLGEMARIKEKTGEWPQRWAVTPGTSREDMVAGTQRWRNLYETVDRLYRGETATASARVPRQKFDPDQPRDESGKWTSGGGGGGGNGGGSAPASLAQRPSMRVARGVGGLAKEQASRALAAIPAAHAERIKDIPINLVNTNAAVSRSGDAIGLFRYQGDTPLMINVAERNVFERNGQQYDQPIDVENTLIHETGHALDHQSGWALSRRQDLADAFEGSRLELTQQEAWDGRYWLSDKQERFAELYAAAHTPPDSREFFGGLSQQRTEEVFAAPLAIVRSIKGHRAPILRAAPDEDSEIKRIGNGWFVNTRGSVWKIINGSLYPVDVRGTPIEKLPPGLYTDQGAQDALDELDNPTRSSWACTVHRFDPSQPRDETGKWTSGGGDGSVVGGDGWRIPANAKHPGEGYSPNAYEANGRIHTNNVYDAQRALNEGRKVELDQPDTLSTLIDQLGATSKEMIARGEAAPNYDLCNVSVAGTNLLCADTVGLARIEMPQLKGDIKDKFIQHLHDQGYGVERTEVLASHLRATQNQLDGVSVAQIAGKLRSGERELKPLVVSADNYVLDGHHNWAAKIGLDAAGNRLETSAKMAVIRIDVPIVKLLDEANTFTGGAGRLGIGEHPGHRGLIDLETVLRVWAVSLAIVRRQRMALERERAAALIERFDENQPRDESGKWTSGGGSGSGDGSTPSASARPKPQVSGSSTASDRGMAAARIAVMSIPASHREALKDVPVEVTYSSKDFPLRHSFANGFYNPEAKGVRVTETIYREKLTPDGVQVENIPIASVERTTVHELGHAYDHASGWNATEAISEADLRDVKRSMTSDERKAARRFLDNRAETFAELYALAYSRDTITRYFGLPREQALRLYEKPLAQVRAMGAPSTIPPPSDFRTFVLRVDEEFPRDGWSVNADGAVYAVINGSMYEVDAEGTSLAELPPGDYTLEEVERLTAEKRVKFDPDQPRDETGKWTSGGGSGGGDSAPSSSPGGSGLSSGRGRTGRPTADQLATWDKQIATRYNAVTSDPELQKPENLNKFLAATRNLNSMEEALGAYRHATDAQKESGEYGLSVIHDGDEISAVVGVQYNDQTNVAKVFAAGSLNPEDMTPALQDAVERYDELGAERIEGWAEGRDELEAFQDAGFYSDRTFGDRDHMVRGAGQTSGEYRIAQNHRTAVRESARDAALAQGFDPSKIALGHASDPDAHFTLNGMPRVAAGVAYNSGPLEGTIKLFPENIGKVEDTPGITAHEVQHVRFRDAMRRKDAEREAFYKDPGPPPNPASENRWERLGGLDAMMKPDGTLRPPYDQRYPAYAALTWDKFSMTELAKADGVSGYSAEWWKSVYDRQTAPEVAINETLAEMARIKLETGRFPPHRGGQPGQLPRSVAEARAHDTLWRNLYRAVDEVYNLPSRPTA